MSTAIANYGDWDFLYAHALLEPDGNRLLERIGAAETAINERLKAITLRDNAEKSALVDALRALQALRSRRRRTANLKRRLFHLTRVPRLSELASRERPLAPGRQKILNSQERSRHWHEFNGFLENPGLGLASQRSGPVAASSHLLERFVERCQGHALGPMD